MKLKSQKRNLRLEMNNQTHSPTKRVLDIVALLLPWKACVMAVCKSKNVQQKQGYFGLSTNSTWLSSQPTILSLHL